MAGFFIRKAFAMPVRPVLRMDDARLLRRAEPVSGFGSGELRALLADMRDTMQALDGVGLAAPQIGVNLRVVIFGVRLRHVTEKTTSHSTRPSKDDDQVAGYAQQPIAGAAACNPLPHQTLTRTVLGVQKSPRYPDMEAVPETVLINPIITVQDEETEDAWEGCLSLPGLRGLVPRFRNIRYQGYDEQGVPIDRAVSGFHARVVQHECDHLDGILYPMRIRDMTQFGFTEELFPGQALQDE
jgi:peptide deformylase